MTDRLILALIRWLPIAVLSLGLLSYMQIVKERVPVTNLPQPHVLLKPPLDTNDLSIPGQYAEEHP